MPRHLIVRHDTEDRSEWWCEWSTVVDAPITYWMTYDEMEQFYRREYGDASMRTEFERMVERARRYGSSDQYTEEVTDWKDHVDCNRAGPDECCLTPDQLVKYYTRVEGEYAAEPWERGRPCDVEDTFEFSYSDMPDEDPEYTVGATIEVRVSGGTVKGVVESTEPDDSVCDPGAIPMKASVRIDFRTFATGLE